MYYQRMGDQIALRLERGEEICSAILALAEKEKIALARVDGLGASDHAVVGLYRLEEQRFSPIKLDRPMEICSLTGNLTCQDGKPYLHLHGVLADETGACFGGHFKEVRVSATAEIFLQILPGKMERFHDDGMGLELWKLENAWKKEEKR